MDIAAFYHCWALGEWRNPLREFLQALDRSDYDAPLTLSVIGSDRDAARVEREAGREHTLVRADVGFEQVTLELVRQYALTHDGAVLYAHTKGAYAHQGAADDPWRKVLTDRVVRDWRANLELLRNHDVVGWAWFDKRVCWDSPAFGGNFWMARCDYVQDLPPLKQGIRGNAELWVGSGSPRVREREQWDREVGPSALQPIWPFLLQRWRWMAAGMPDKYPPPAGVDPQFWVQIIRNMKANVEDEAALAERMT